MEPSGGKSVRKNRGQQKPGARPLLLQEYHGVKCGWRWARTQWQEVKSFIHSRNLYWVLTGFQSVLRRSPCRATVLSRFGCVRLFVTLWTVGHQAPLSMGFSRQDYWSGLSCPSPGDLADLEMGSNHHLLCLRHWQAGSLSLAPPGTTALKSLSYTFLFLNKKNYVFIYFWLCWVFSAASRLSLIVASKGYSLVSEHRHKSKGLVVTSQDMESPQNRDRILVPCIGR